MNTEKETILERRRIALDFVSKLKPEQLNMRNWITKWKIKDGHVCGTVCCFGGYLPTMFPSDFFFDERCFEPLRIIGKSSLASNICTDIITEIISDISHFFNITKLETIRIIYADEYLKDPVTPEMLLDRLKEVFNSE